MTDAQLQALIVAQLTLRMPQDTGLATLAGLTVAQAFQPEQAGRQSPPTVYFFKVGHRRYGFTGSKVTALDPVPPAPVGTMRQDDVQVYEQRYQFMALVPQSPEAPQRLTASDVVDTVAGIMGSEACRAALQAQGVGILRITDVRNPFFTNDKGRFEADPSFDVVFTHTRTRSTIVPQVSAYDVELVRV